MLWRQSGKSRCAPPAETIIRRRARPCIAAILVGALCVAQSTLIVVGPFLGQARRRHAKKSAKRNFVNLMILRGALVFFFVFCGALAKMLPRGWMVRPWEKKLRRKFFRNAGIFTYAGERRDMGPSTPGIEQGPTPATQKKKTNNNKTPHPSKISNGTSQKDPITQKLGPIPVQREARGDGRPKECPASSTGPKIEKLRSAFLDVASPEWEPGRVAGCSRHPDPLLLIYHTKENPERWRKGM